VDDRERLVEAVTERVLRLLEAEGEGSCVDCEGGCAASCSDKVRAMLAVGATRVSYQGRGGEVPRDLGSYIDHTLLKPEATPADIDRLCDEAVEYGFATVCVNPVWVRRAASRLRRTDVKVTSVVGFPLGASAPEIKALEARRALRDGAREIDMVINVGALKAGDLELVVSDIARVAEACREVGAVCKVIIEAALLSDEEKVVASRLAQRAKAHYVKTSTGFGPGGARVFDVGLMREAVGPAMGIKAAGGIKTREQVQELIRAGATRIGASAGVSIVSGRETGANSGRY
jgi:deoxyribose-phosphate aldolase